MKHLIALSCLFALPGCSSVPEGPWVPRAPKFSVTGFRITGLTLEDVYCRTELSVDNPNPFAIKFQKGDYKIFLEDALFQEGETTGEVNFAARRRSGLNISYRVKLVEAAAVVAAMASQRELKFRVEGGANFGGGELALVRLPYACNGVLPIPRPVSFHFSRPKVDARNPLAPQVTIAFKAKNKNAFPILSLGGRLQLTLSGRAMGDVDAAVPEQIAADAEGAGSITLTVSSVAVVRFLLENSGDLEPALTGEVTAKTPYGDLKMPVGP